MSQSPSANYLIKVVVIGCSGVGKTSICEKVVNPLYDCLKVIPTCGVGFKIKKLPLGEEREVKLHIFDSAGQQNCMDITKSYLRDAGVILIVFDITNRSTFKAVPDYIQKVKDTVHDQARIVLIGNKIDMRDKCKMTRKEAEAVVKQHKLFEYFEMSAKKGESVLSAFEIPALQFIQDIERKKIILSEDFFGVKTRDSKSEKTIKIIPQHKKQKQKKGC